MGKLAVNQTLRGADVSVRLYRGGQPLDIIEAEEIEIKPELKVIESEPLSVGHTQRDTHVDGVQATVKGVRKGNQFLQEILDQIAVNMKTGFAISHYTAVINYRDLNTKTVQSVKIADASLTEIDPFNSGKNFDKQTEGFAIIGLLG